MITFKATSLFPHFDFGMLPSIFWKGDERPASEQLDERYSYGGGFSPLDGGWELDTLNVIEEGMPEFYTLTYPNDSPVNEIGRAQLNDETLVFFQHSWLAIIQSDGSFVVTRVD